jgi:beta-lactamase class A
MSVGFRLPIAGSRLNRQSAVAIVTRQCRGNIMQARSLSALFIVALLAVPCLAQPTQAPSPAALLRQQTAARLHDIATRVDGVVGYSIVDLTSGERFEWQPDVVLPTASTIKLGILYELARAVDEGRVKWDETRVLDRTRAVPGGLLYDLGTPTLSLRDYAVAMAVLSDNTATNVLIERLGMERVTARMRELGLQQTKLRRYMIDLEAAKRGNENVSTPGEIVRLLEAYHRGTGLTPASRDEAMKILKKEKIPLSPMALGLPAGTELANKPGDLEGVRVDAGIVYAKNRPYAFSAMTSFLLNDQAGEALITELSRVAYGYFSRIGAGTEYGRQLGR